MSAARARLSGQGGRGGRWSALVVIAVLVAVFAGAGRTVASATSAAPADCAVVLVGTSPQDCAAYDQAYQDGQKVGGKVLAGTTSASVAEESSGDLVTLTMTNELTPFDADWIAGDDTSNTVWGMISLGVSVNGPVVSESPATNADVTTYVDSANTPGVASTVRWSANDAIRCTDQATCAFSSGEVFSVTFRVNDTRDDPYRYRADWDSLGGSQPGTSNLVGWPSGTMVSELDLPVASGTPPTAAINYHPTGTTANQWVFDGSPSQPGSTGAAITRYAWDFGDGTSSTSASSTVTHTFTGEGDKTVTLTVTDAQGQTGTTSTTLAPALAITTISHTPTAIGVGTSFTESVTVQNVGPTTVTGVVPSAGVVDPTIASLGSTWTPASATIAPGLAQTFTISGTGLKAGSTTLNAAASGAAGGDPVTAPQRTAALAVAVTGLSISLVNPPPALVAGSATTVQVKVTALGSQGATDVTVADPIKISGDGGFSIAARPTGADAKFTLAAQGDSRTVAFQLKATTPGALDYSVSVSGTDAATRTTSTATVSGSFASAVLTVNTTGDQALNSTELAENLCDVDPVTAGSQCTLRAAIQLADARADNESIAFDIPGAGVPQIAPSSALPAITTATTIDGSTQPGGWVQLLGSGTLSTANGLDLTNGASLVRGLIIDGWGNAGVQVEGASGVVIQGDRIGTDPSGTSAVGNYFGIWIDNGSAQIGGTNPGAGCTGECVLISGNSSAGVYAGQAARVTIQGSLIGTDDTGEVALPNVATGIAGGLGDRQDPVEVVLGGATTDPGHGLGNVISGNPTGVRVWGATGPMVVTGNIIGLDQAGTHSLEPTTLSDPTARQNRSGVYALRDHSVLVGGTAPSDANLIGGFIGNGVIDSDYQVDVTGTTTVEHNRVGTDLTGTHAVPNGNGINGGELVENNQVSGNTDVGVLAAATAVSNLIGTTPDGEHALPNGVGVQGGTTIGAARPPGDTACDDGCNLISGNTGSAVIGSGNVLGNFIGTDLSGTRALPNQATAGATATVFGGGSVGGASGAVHGVCDQLCNLIAGNAAPAIGQEHIVQGNLIGTTISGSALPNQGSGVADSDVVGGEGGLGNLIAFSPGSAITIDQAASRPTDFQGDVMIGNGDGVSNTSATVVSTPAPKIASVAYSGSDLHITGNATGLVSTEGFPTARIDVYGATSCGLRPQSAVAIGSVAIGSIDPTFALTAHHAPVEPFYLVTTTIDGNTSQFTSCLTASGTPFLGVAGSTSTVTPGGSLTITGQGFTSDEPVTITLHSTPLRVGVEPASADGTVRATVTIPASTPAGQHHLILTGTQSGVSVSLAITVAVAPSSSTSGASGANGSSSGELADTGYDTGSGLAVAIALLLAGAGTLIVGRRRS